VQRDFEVRELREMNKTAVKQIGEVVQQHPDLRQAVALYFNQAALPPPPIPGEGAGSGASSRYSSRPSSARSSVSSVRSSASATAAKTVNIGADFGMWLFDMRATFLHTFCSFIRSACCLLSCQQPQLSWKWKISRCQKVKLWHWHNYYSI
jgi:hypothetical protein